MFADSGRDVQGPGASHELGRELQRLGLAGLGPAWRQFGTTTAVPCWCWSTPRWWTAPPNTSWFEARTVRANCSTNRVGGRPTTPALERVMEANNLLSGLGVESGGVAVAHAVHNGITEIAASHRCIHGETVAFGLITQLVLKGRPAPKRDQRASALPARRGLADHPG